MTRGRVRWLPWGSAAFDRAAESGRPILLGIVAAWSDASRIFDARGYADERASGLIEESFIPVRVDIDERPDLHHRYGIGALPAVVFLNATGDVLSGLCPAGPDHLVEALLQVRDRYAAARDEMDQRARILRLQSLEAAAPASAGVPGRETVDEVLALLRATVDGEITEYRQLPLPVRTEALRLAWEESQREDESMLRLAERMLPETSPAEPLLLEDAAMLLSVVVDSYVASADDGLRGVSARLIGIFDRRLARRDGLFNPWSEKGQPHDSRAFVAGNAAMARAYLSASVALERPELARRATSVIRAVVKEATLPNGTVAHQLHQREPVPVSFLIDQLRTAALCLTAWQVLGEREHLDLAVRLAHLAVREFGAADGSLCDSVQPPGPLGHLAYRVVSVSETAEAALFLVELAALTHDPAWRGVAEAALAAVSGGVEAHGLAAAGYARAVGRMVEEPLQVTVIAPTGGVELHRAGLRLRQLNRVVQLLRPDRDADILAASGFPADQMPRAYACRRNLCTPPVTSSATLEEAVAMLGGAELGPVDFG
ncbi:MAG: DUF255 domain-containing protein [Candidatus Dormibacteria bacterium]